VYKLIPRPFPLPVFDHLWYEKTREKAQDNLVAGVLNNQ